MGREHSRPLILAYHAVDSGWASPLAVSQEALAAQAAHFRDRGYVGLTLTEAEYRRRAGTLSARSVVFTFDDAYASVRRAKPVLDRHGFPGTVFVVTAFADSNEPMRWVGVEAEPQQHMRPLAWHDVGELSAGGWEVGSHTVTHPLLTSLADADLQRELEDSRAEIERRLGSCTSLAYPYGVADGRVAAAAALAGYTVACSLTGAQVADEPLRRPRIGLGSADVGLRLRTKVSEPALRLRRTPVARMVRAARPHRAWIPWDAR